MIRAHHIAIGLLLAVGAGFILLQTRELTQLLVSHFAPKPVPHPSIRLGEVTKVQGLLWQRHSWETTERQVLPPVPLDSGDHLRLAKGDSFSIQLLNGYEIELYENSRIVIEQWNPALSDSPILLSILMGEGHLSKTGPTGQLFIFKNGQLLQTLPSLEGGSRPFMVNIQQRDPSVGLLHDPTAAVETDAPPSNRPVDSNSGLPSTLSNEFMDEVLAAQKGKFSNCQANAIRSGQSAKGLVTIGFIISSDGKVKEPRVLTGLEVDRNFQTCLLGAVGETRFKPFLGPQIVRSFEIQFE